MIGNADRSSQGVADARSGSLLLRVLLAIAAMLALGAAGPALASATGHWKESAGLPITKPTSIEWAGKLKVGDTEDKGVSLSVECNDKVQGTVSTSGSGEITKVTVSGCTGVAFCAKTTTHTTIRALNLPWDTALEKEGGFQETITGSGAGSPGFFVECDAIGIPIEDTCTGTKLALDFTKLEPVEAAFDKRDKLTCVQGKETGYAEGGQGASGVAGVEETTPVWLKSGMPVTKEQAASWSKGSLAVVDDKNGPGDGPRGVACEDGGEGTIGTEGVDLLTKLTLSKCTNVSGSECTGTDSLEAIHLPWKGQLYMRATETIGNLLAEDGNGVPAFKMKCENDGIKEEETCEAGPSAGHRLSTYATDAKELTEVSISFNRNVHLTCTRDGGGEFGEVTESSNYLLLGFGVQL